MKENRNCEFCIHRNSRIEMVAPSVSGMVDYCTRGRIVYKAEPCEEEEEKRFFRKKLRKTKFPPGGEFHGGIIE